MNTYELLECPVPSTDIKYKSCQWHLSPEEFDRQVTFLREETGQEVEVTFHPMSAGDEFRSARVELGDWTVLLFCDHRDPALAPAVVAVASKGGETK